MSPTPPPLPPAGGPDPVPPGAARADAGEDAFEHPDPVRPPPLPPDPAHTGAAHTGASPAPDPWGAARASEAAAAAGEAHRYPCPTCGANLRYQPGSDELRCAHCGATFPIPGARDGARANRELDYRAAADDRLPAEAMQELRTAHCPNCGAVVELEGAAHAAECPFCATPVVLDSGPHRQIKPRGLLPFRLTESEARQRMGRWLGRLWFAPTGLQEYARRGRAMEAIYVPFWTFDAETETDYRGERGDAYYVTRTVTRNGKTQQVQERRIRWSPRRGKVARFFDDLLVVASRALPRHYIERLAPWDLADLRDYRPEFLAGYRAEGYTVELAAGMEEARQVMEAQIRQDIRADIGGDEQRIHAMEVRFGDVTFKHVLLPVFVAAYRYSGKSYRFVVNGRTGAVQGERPWSKWKIALAVVLFLILGAIFLALNGEF